MATMQDRSYRELKITRLTTRWREQQARVRGRDATIEANLKSLGFWDQ